MTQLTRNYYTTNYILKRVYIYIIQITFRFVYCYVCGNFFVFFFIFVHNPIYPNQHTCSRTYTRVSVYVRKFNLRQNVLVKRTTPPQHLQLGTRSCLQFIFFKFFFAKLPVSFFLIILSFILFFLLWRWLLYKR